MSFYKVLCKKLVFLIGSIDGVFGNLTYNSVVAFQKNFGLSPDGIVGSATWNSLFPYLYGYTSYVIKPGDTLYNIALRFSTSVSRILVANPSIEPNFLLPRFFNYCSFWKYCSI